MYLTHLYESKPSGFSSGIDIGWPTIGPIIRARIYDFLQAYTTFNGKKIKEVWQGEDRQKGVWKFGSGTPICLEIPDPKEKNSYYLKCNPTLINPASKIPPDWRPEWFRRSNREVEIVPKLTELVGEYNGLKEAIDNIVSINRHIRDWMEMYKGVPGILGRLEAKFMSNEGIIEKALERYHTLESNIKSLKANYPNVAIDDSKVKQSLAYKEVSDEDINISPVSSDINELLGNEQRQRFLTDNISSKQIYALSDKYSKVDIVRALDHQLMKEYGCGLAEHEFEWLVKQYDIVFRRGRRPNKFVP